MKENFTLLRRAAFLLLLAVTFGTLSVQAQELGATKSKVSALSKDVGFTARKFQKSDPKASKISAQKMADRRAKARAVRKAPDGATFFEDFEGITTDGELPEGWTAIDADGDGFNWSSHVNTGTGNHTTHSGDVTLYSESYSNDSGIPLTPDNWLITPKVALGGTLRVWAIGQDANYCDEHFAFYVSVAGNTDVADFVQIAPASGEFVATGAYVEYIADLGAYAGQEGYIAIRHFNVSDEFILVIDDFAIVDEVAPVTNLQVADVTSSQATVSWSGTYDSFNVRYRTAYDTGATYFQDFEGDIEGWASYTENEGDGWELGSLGDEYGIVAYSESYSSSTGLDVDNWLISPKLALGGTLKFSEYVSSSWPDSYEVLLSTTTDEKESFTITLREMAVGAGDWNEVSIDLSAYEGQEGYIAIHHVSSNCYYLIIDNFGLFGEPVPAGEWVETTTTENSLILTGLNPETTYEVQVQGVTGETTTSWADAVQFTTLVSGTPVPTNVTVTDITTDGATISWQGEADSYNVRYRSGEGEWTETTATEKSIALTGLENNVQYEVQVQAVYGELTSEWTEPVTFTTLKIFPKPSDFAVTDLTYNGAKLTWKANGDETGWQIYISTTSTVDGSELEGLLVPVDEPEYILTDLEEYTTYYVFLRAVYEDGVSEFFTSNFKTPEQFPTPKNFEYFGDVTFTSFGVIWDENANATGYEYIVSTTSLTDAQIEENAESAVATVEPYFYFTDGEPQTDYYLYFRTLYEDGVSSWVYPGFITTQKVPTPTNVAVSDIDSESAVVTWTSDEAIEQYKLRYRTKGVDPSGEETVALSENFDGLSEGSLPEGWTAIDADGDEYNWGASGDGTMVSDSFKGGVALSPDNWLITPKVQLDGLLKFNAKNSSSYYPDKMAVYVSTTGTDVEDFVEVLEPITPPTSWTEYTVDLRSFAGQEGYVAFRHSFVTDQLHIYIDDVSITTYENSGTPAGKWVEIDASETTAELTELEAETDYEVQVQGFYHGFVSDWSNIVSFTTGDFFSLPTQITVSDITADAATVNWKNSKAENYFVQYRVAGEDPTVLFEDFEGVIPEGSDYTYDLPEGWTTIDADGDGNSWYIVNSVERAHSGIAVATSASYFGEPLTPDNWLITPKVPLDGTLHAWFRGQDPDWSSEPYAIYVSTTGTEIADFTEVLPRTVATAEYVEQVVDLSEYAGQEGYVAFRHYDVTDQFRLNLDDVAIYKEVSVNEWTYLYDYEEAPCTLTDLQPETKYEVRVGAVFYTREGEPIKIEGTNSVFFTTLAEEVDAIDDLAADVKAGRTDVYTLTGIRLKGMPTQRGFYIVNGKKIYVK